MTTGRNGEIAAAKFLKNLEEVSEDIPRPKTLHNNIERNYVGRVAAIEANSANDLQCNTGLDMPEQSNEFDDTEGFVDLHNSEN